MMNQQSSKMMNESKIINTFTGFYLHEFSNKNKQRIAEGNCLILQYRGNKQTGSQIYLKMNNFDLCKIINSSVFVKMVYARSTSYIFFDQLSDNHVYAISTTNSATDLIALQTVLIKFGNVVDYQSPSLNHEIKIKIDSHIENLNENEVIITYNKTTKLVKSIGNFFGKIGKAVENKSNQFGTAFEKKVERVSRQSFSESTHQKWKGFKEKASGINDKLVEAIKPIGQKVKGIVGDIGTSYYTSNNGYVKSFREFTTQAQNSINDGYIAQIKVDQKPSLDDNHQQMVSQKVNAGNQQINSNNDPSL